LRHLPALLLAKPIPLIEANELRRWRDSLLQASLIPAAINRVLGGVVAALNLAAAHDPRIKSRQPWHVGLQGLPDATRARNVVLSDDQVRKLISAAYDRGERFGLFVETLGVTGARPSQVSRIEVGDLRAADPAEAKLMMPRSGKGGGRLRIRKKVERISVPITAALAARLKASAAGRPSNAPLLLGRDDRGWGVEPSANYRADFRAIVAEVGLDPAEVTAYALRHSSIVRMLLAGIPVRLVASLHDTSVTEIERHYSRYISEGTHSDSLTRRALLAEEPPIAANVVALAR
jgi:integrase